MTAPWCAVGVGWVCGQEFHSNCRRPAEIATSHEMNTKAPPSGHLCDDRLPERKKTLLFVITKILKKK